MRNPFIIIRFIFFSLMIYMNILTIVFASWNVAAWTYSGLSAPGASVFLILNSCALFAFITAGLAGLVFPNTRTANVAFECGWTAIVSLLQLGAAIAVTVYGPALVCQSETAWGICASSHLLVSASWLSSFTIISYFLMLFGAAIAHMHSYPFIWWNTVYSVPWFVPPTSNEPDPRQSEGSPSRSKIMSASSDRSHESSIAVRYLRHRFSTKIEEVENLTEPILFPRQNNGLPAVQPRASLPGWAQKGIIRRGLDTPFARKEDTASAAETSELATPQPRKAHFRRGVDPPFATRVGPTIPPAIYIASNPHFDVHPLSLLRHKNTISPAFSHNVEDQDSPIPLPSHSEWIPAISNSKAR